MSVSDLGRIQIPPGAALWIDRAMLVFLGLFILWVVLKVIGFAMRRAYNLTPVATAGSKDVKPDFLKVDHAAQQQLIERGRAFDHPPSNGLATAARLANAGMVVSGALTFVLAAFLAIGHIQDFDATWRTLSTKDKFVALIQSHPVGFVLAFAMIIVALYELMKTIRTAK